MKLTTVYKFSKWLTVFFLAVVVLGTVLAIRTHFFLLRAITATGTITELIEQKEDRGEIYYKPVFLFKDAKGEIHKAPSPTLSFGSGQARIGDKYELLYDPENPLNIRENMFLSIWGIEILLVGFGFLNILFFLIVMLISRRMLNTASKNNAPQSNMPIIPVNVKSWNRLSKIMMTISGIAMFFAVVLTVHTIIFLLYAMPATGTIVEVEQKEDMDSKIISYIPVFTFQDAKGVTYKVSSPTETTLTPLVGEKIEILYNPMNPNHTRENGFFGLWGQAINYVIGAFIFWLAAFIIKRRNESKQRRSGNE